MKGDTEIAVIGAGAAGIAAARALAEAGVACLLIEARDRLGGRAFTANTGGYALDLGCGWLHSADANEWAKIAEAQGKIVDHTPPPWSRLRDALPAGFPVEEQHAYRAAMLDFFERVGVLAQGGPHDPDPPASAALPAGGRWNPLMNAIGTYISGAELDLVSAKDFDAYEDSHVNWRIAEGYGTTIADHARGVPLTLGAPVTRIDHSGKRLRIATAKGDITADRVIVTLPTSILGAEEALFHPALPEKTNAARKLPLGLADKLFIALDRADEFEAESRIFGNKDATATATYHLRPFGRPMIEAYFGGANARALEGEGERAFFDFAVAELTAHLGADFAKRLRPLGMHLWWRDPFARGSYSYAVPGAFGERAVLAAPVDGRLFFAGEATSLNDFSTAHGACRTGLAAAAAAIVGRKLARADVGQSKR